MNPLWHALLEVRPGVVRAVLSSPRATFGASDTKPHLVPLIFEAWPPIGMLMIVALMRPLELLELLGWEKFCSHRGTRAHTSNCDQ